MATAGGPPRSSVSRRFRTRPRLRRERSVLYRRLTRGGRGRLARHAQGEPEARALSGRRPGFEPHLPAMREDDFPGEVEPEPDAFALGTGNAEELLEDPVAVL